MTLKAAHFIAALVIIFCAWTDGVSAGTVQLPRTGQIKCYDSGGAEIPCAGTGQDGDTKAGVAWPSPRFAVSGECVTDHLTGLMWAKNADLANGAKAWDAALTWVKTLNLCGHADWRVPNVNEMNSLFNAGEFNNAAWLMSQGFTNVHNSETAFYNWLTSTAFAGGEGYAVWQMDTHLGTLLMGATMIPSYVWPVRGTTTAPAMVWRTGQTKSYKSGDDGDLKKGAPWPSPRFANNGNGTVTDKLTDLMWTTDANAPGPALCDPGTPKTTWSHAIDYVKCLNNAIYLGHSDWRLPNREDLLSLIDRGNLKPALPSGHPFANVQAGGPYWSSTSDARCKEFAWTVGMTMGDAEYDYKGSDGGKTYDNYVWPVRGGIASAGPTLSVAKSGTGTGTVTSAPAGINCGSACAASFTKGTVVVLTASPAVSSTFTGWSEACTGTNKTCRLTMDGSKNAQAGFSVKQFAVSATVSGGHGKVNPAGQKVNYGSTAGITITPDTGYAIRTVKDNGTAKAATSPYAIANVTSAHNVVVTFAPLYAINVTKSGTGTGTVTSAPAGINCGSTCGYSFIKGTVVTLTAAAASGSSFKGWSGGGCHGLGVCRVTVNATTTVSAVFTKK